MNASDPQLWVIVGATGVGKSQFSLCLAEALTARGRKAEVVNADAMQFYRGMDIGTAKLPLAERREIAHHLFDVLAPSQEATVAWYQPEARARIEEIQSRGADAILVGGSGLYVSSVMFDFRFPPRDDGLRAKLEAELEQLGTDTLFGRLQELDPAAAASIDGRNGRRVVRALELQALGESAHGTLPNTPALWQEATRVLGVHTERQTLVERLDRRVEAMWADGLLDEVRGLIPYGIEHGPTASRGIGYAQALAQLAGRATESEAIETTQALTRRYARRQVSWFKRYPNVEWFDSGRLSAVGLTQAAGALAASRD
jgi:tRNA dimethylallyltransferase